MPPSFIIGLWPAVLALSAYYQYFTASQQDYCALHSQQIHRWVRFQTVTLTRHVRRPGPGSEAGRLRHLRIRANAI
jgi:hypothetical protein